MTRCFSCTDEGISRIAVYVVAGATLVSDDIIHEADMESEGHLDATLFNGAIAELLIACGADPHQSNHGGWTLMDAATGLRGQEVVALLRAHGVPYALHHAIGNGDLATAAAMLDAEPELLETRVTRRRSTPLHIGARTGQVEAVELLLEAGAEVDPTDKEAFTPLAVLAAYGPKDRRPAVAMVLLAHGADPRAGCGYSGLDVVGYAKSKRDHELVAILQDAAR